MPRKQITIGGAWRHSAVFAPNTYTTLISLRSGGSAPTAGTEILRVRVAAVSTTFAGSVVVASSFRLELDYLLASTLTLTAGVSLLDPWVDPALGLNYHTLRFVDITTRLVAVAVRTSTHDETLNTYATDGEIRLFVDNVEVWAATGLHFAHKNSALQTELTKVGFGVPLCMDRIWVRNGSVALNTDADGAIPASADQLLYEDAGNLVGWTAWEPDAAALLALPQVIADAGVGGGIGYSVSTAAGTALISSSGGGANARGMRQLVTLFEPPPPVEPPPVVTTACPVTLGPVAAGGGSACPVGGATLTSS